jgi:threonine synthase
MFVCHQCGLSTNSQVPDDPRRRLENENLETEIARVEAYLSRLVQKRTPLKQEIKDFVSPIIRLPHEIPSAIFLACLLEDFRDVTLDETPGFWECLQHVARSCLVNPTALDCAVHES